MKSFNCWKDQAGLNMINDQIRNFREGCRKHLAFSKGGSSQKLKEGQPEERVPKMQLKTGVLSARNFWTPVLENSLVF